MPANDREVFEYLTSDPDSSLHVDYLAYAIFAHEKSEWIKHFERQNVTPPSQDQIDTWISNLTDHQFQNMRSVAVSFFDNAASEYYADRLKQAEEDATNSAIVAQVKAASPFWKQAFIALITAIVAPLILGAVITFAINYDKWFPTIRDISDTMGTPN